MYQCPKGHASIDSDYCSECGASIKGQTIFNNTNSSPTISGLDVCPDCATPRINGSRFCEVCRYDFQGKVSNTPTVSPSVSVIAPGQVEPPISATTTIETVVAASAETMEPLIPIVSPTAQPVHRANIRINAVVSTDLSKLTEEEKVQYKLPTDIRDKTFPLDLDENLVGRRSEDKKIFPEIDIYDPGVSKRHLKLLKQDDGTFSALELNSSNGTILNGVNLEPGILTPIKVGDEFNIGLWTVLKLK